ncbi:alkaline phosphatase family protein [Pseudonocardiaceae bacterium YIM PH 21723]|nr:alkaline phosphatase family protein [Pseudonocardiaceae bacterium YIM PH 21723]
MDDHIVGSPACRPISAPCRPTCRGFYPRQVPLVVTKSHDKSTKQAPHSGPDTPDRRAPHPTRRQESPHPDPVSPSKAILRQKPDPAQAIFRHHGQVAYTLADVLPSVAASFGLDTPAPLQIAPNRDVVLLLIDGLGAELLARHSGSAPTLAAHVGTTLNAGFPATTAVSLTSLAMGAPCATHGIIGSSFAVPEADGIRVLNALRWKVDAAFGEDARELYPPEQVQPRASRLEDLAAHGVELSYVVPDYYDGSGLTRAAFRAPGTLYPAATLDELRAGILAATRDSGTRSRFTYAYFSDLDMNGHIHGPGSAEWLETLRAIDAWTADLLTELPASCTLLITGDHGMVRADRVIDLDADAELQRGVRLIAGEARVRHVHLDRPDALGEVLARWTEVLSTDVRVATREQALDEHWFGPTPPDAVIARRIGDVLAVAEGGTVLVCPEREPLESIMIGHHGSWTVDEQAVPLISSQVRG